jgi:pimeloyl-ACP methyl ester carboxylesterase
MRTLVDPADPARRSPLTLALLTGTYSEPEDFVREGFPLAARGHGIDADIVMAPVRAAWFADGTIVQRIRDAVIGPARSDGARRIWLVGISLGGLAALSYAARHAGDVDGVLMISPYPATREVLRELEAARSLAAWSARIGPEGDLEREAWRFLASGAPTPQVHCYFASGDRFAEGQRRMARALAPERVRELPGGHDWLAWRALWDAFLRERKAVLQ